MKFNFINQKRSLVTDADRARDAGRWRHAVELYEEHIKVKPTDFPIIVQLANCLKEAGDHQKAYSTYQRALKLNPLDSDVFLQQGHLLKLMNRKGESLLSYKMALEIDPKNQNAIRELIEMGEFRDFAADQTVVVEAVNTIWLDITDLIEYAKHNRSLSGIQRVVANLASFASQHSLENFRIIPVVPEYDKFRIRAVKTTFVEALVRLFDVQDLSRESIDKAIEAVYASRYDVVPGAGDAMVVAGAFWIYPHYDAIARLRQNGMRFGVFIHDLIQIKSPEYVHHDAVVVFQKKLVDILSVTDFVLTNSHFVAEEVRNYLDEKLNFTVPVEAIPLATELRERKKSAEIIDQEIVDVCKDEFVLCVCTIEVRKNHLYLVKIWERLRARYGDKTPNLVFVGKWGWDIEDLQNYLEKLGCIGDWLHIFNGISDNALEYIYERCLFTAYVSFAEGFGLPIGESLAHGKPCIASNTTSMPEVGGDFARYIDPFDIESGYRIFEKTILDRDELKSWASNIRKKFAPKSWASFCTEFYNGVEKYHRKLDGIPAQQNCLLPAGAVVCGGDAAVKRLAAANARIITFDAARRSGWSYMEDWGVWSISRRASLEFATDLQPETEIQIYLRLRRPPGDASTRVIIRCGDRESSLDLSGTDKFFAFAGIVGANSLVQVQLVAQGRFPDTGVRQCYIGLTAIGFCQRNDPLARMDLLEKVVLG